MTDVVTGVEKERNVRHFATALFQYEKDAFFSVYLYLYRMRHHNYLLLGNRKSSPGFVFRVNSFFVGSLIVRSLNMHAKSTKAVQNKVFGPTLFTLAFFFPT